jgi:hypothetical protein
MRCYLAGRSVRSRRDEISTGMSGMSEVSGFLRGYHVVRRRDMYIGCVEWPAYGALSTPRGTGRDLDLTVVC